MSHFASDSAAERYASARPYFHPLVVARIADACCPTGKIAAALDVGCGTGQSSLALAEIALEVVGVDVARSMLDHAHRHPRISYVESPAEALPFADRSFNLISLGLAFHWLDRRKFLREAARVLRPGGWLAIYNDHFSGRMVENDEYARWNRDHYARRYPSPPRNSEPLTDEAAREHGFARVKHEAFEHVVAFAPDQLVGYLVTQSNVTAAEAHGESAGSIAEWLASSVRPLFRSEVGHFPFNCILDIFRRQA